MCKGILIFGLNGSGKTTIGLKVARVLNYKHVDVEDYYFNDAEIPYSNPRTKEEATKLMLEDIYKYKNFIFTGVTTSYGKELDDMFELAVLLNAPFDLRIKRIEQRALNKFGKRVMIGGDMYEQELGFLEYVKKRKESEIINFVKQLSCPVITIDTTRDIDANISLIVKEYKKGKMNNK